MMHVRLWTTVAGITLLLVNGPVSASAEGQGDPTAAPLMRLLKSGRLPAERIGPVVELICQRGNKHDLAYVFGRALTPDGFPKNVRRRTFQWLADAARTRKVMPAGDLSGLGKLVAGGEASIRLTAVELAGLWKVDELVDELCHIALSEKADARLRQAAIEALVEIGGTKARTTIEELASDEHPQAMRYRAVAALVEFNLDRAAELAREVLRDGTESDEPDPMMAAFLNQKGGAERLAAALKGQNIPADVAKLALRYMYSVGRSDAPLSDVLSEAAGIETDVKPLSEEEIKQIAAVALAEGDPARGESIFRRADLSCMKCHSVAKAGGQVGPDLSAVGSSSPAEYLVKSILFPNEAIKEEFQTSVIVTSAGKILTGIVVDRNQQRVVIKEANGKERTISTADIVLEREGKSLMPQGLTKFLTHSELIDLVRFLSELGKPGEYAIRKTPTIQRWRVMKNVPEELVLAVPDEELFRQKVLETDPSRWEPAYGKVSGELPLDELRSVAAAEVVYLQGEIEVTAAGRLRFRVDAPEDATRIWINDEAADSARRFVVDLERGVHKVTLRMNISERENPALRVQVLKPQGSPVQYAVVAGS